MSTLKPVLYLFIGLSLLLFASPGFSGEYRHSVTADKMTFDWTLEGETLAIRISAPTKGWIGIGFNPSKKMKDANFVVGYVKKGKTTISDEYGTHPAKHAKDSKKGGEDNVTLVSGTEKGKNTTLEFSIPVNSGDKLDGNLDPNGDTIVLLAYGPDRDSLRMKHTYHKVMTINLTTGEMK